MKDIQVGDIVYIKHVRNRKKDPFLILRIEERYDLDDHIIHVYDTLFRRIVTFYRRYISASIRSELIST